MDELTVELWIIEARERGLPVFVTGLVLLVAVLGVPVGVAGLVMLLPMLLVLVCSARAAFLPVDPDPDWP